MKVWTDLKMPHEPAFFSSLFKDIKVDVFYTCRDYANIFSLSELYGLEATSIGGRPEGNILYRKIGFSQRVLQLLVNVADFDISINHMSPWQNLVSKIRGKKTISFYDNELNPLNSSQFKWVDVLITPASIPIEILKRRYPFIPEILQFDGFKEDIYIADFKPDESFHNKIPFSDFVAVRPESLQAMYVPHGTKSILVKILKLLNQNGIKTLFFPRYPGEESLAYGLNNVHIVDKPLRGLDVCYYSKAIITGAGTWAREAAIMGTPAVSFFPGKRLLSVDRKLIDQGKIFFSRNPESILSHVKKSVKIDVNTESSIRTKNEVVNLINKMLMKSYR